MDLNVLKTQLSAVLMVEDTKNSGNAFHAIYGYVVMTALDYVFKLLHFLIHETREYVTKQCRAKAADLSSVMAPVASASVVSNKVKTCSITIDRVFDKNSQNDLADSLLDLLGHVDESRHVDYHHGSFIVTHHDEVKIGSYQGADVYCRVLQSYVDHSNFHREIKSIRFEVYSPTLSLGSLRAYVADVVSSFNIKKKNMLGDQVFYFDEVVQGLPMDISGKIMYGKAPKTLVFRKTPFYTNKSLSSMFGSDIELVYARLRWFLERPDWYASKGVPYTFGLLLHGEPGCGKASMIKAIAKETSRHILNLRFHDYLTQQQMNSLFFNERVFIHDSQDSYIIRQDQRLYCIEEVDCSSTIVLDRRLEEEEREKAQNGDESSLPGTIKGQELLEKQHMNQSLTLGFLLNLLDGILEMPGRVLIMTTNYPDRLDKALIRPGRIDLILDFRKATRQSIMAMFHHFYDLKEKVAEDRFEGIRDYQFSPAEVNQILFKHINDPLSALDDLLSE